MPTGRLGVPASSALALGHGGADDAVRAAAKDDDQPDEDDRVPERLRLEHERAHPVDERFGDGLHAVEGVGQDVPADVLDPADVADLAGHLQEVARQVAEPDPDAGEEVREAHEDVADHTRCAVVEGEAVRRVGEEGADHEQPDEHQREQLVVPRVAEERHDQAEAGLDEEAIHAVDEDEGDDGSGDGQDVSWGWLGRKVMGKISRARAQRDQTSSSRRSSYSRRRFCAAVSSVMCFLCSEVGRSMSTTPIPSIS